MYKQWGEYGACPGGSGTALSRKSWPSECPGSDSSYPVDVGGAVGGDSNMERVVSPLPTLSIIPSHRDPVGWYVGHLLPPHGPCAWMLSSFLESIHLGVGGAALRPSTSASDSLSLSDATGF